MEDKIGGAQIPPPPGSQHVADLGRTSITGMQVTLDETARTLITGV
jgi:hypothetical protein